MGLSRLSDNDKRFGPLTVSSSDSPWRAFYVYLEAFTDEDDEDRKSYNTLTVHFWGWLLFRLILPVMIKPIRYKVKAGWDEATVLRLGRDWYYKYCSKRYGFMFDKTHLTSVFGKKVNDVGMLVDRNTHIDFPWMAIRPFDMEIYDQNNNLYTRFPLMRRKWDVALPMTYLELEDYDGARVIASVNKEVRVYRRFAKPLKWLGNLLPTIRYPSMDITFSTGIGRRKNDWKGGTIGHNIVPLDNKETPADAIKRYCDIHGLKFIGYAGFGNGCFEKKETKPQSVEG